jgi:TfoX/Sxy family transcriptional regulator of competence genes
MAYSSLQFREYLCEQLAIAGTVDLRPMFHSYCVYLDGVAIGWPNDACSSCAKVRRAGKL